MPPDCLAAVGSTLYVYTHMRIQDTYIYIDIDVYTYVHMCMHTCIYTDVYLHICHLCLLMSCLYGHDK